ncbi:hypothetical protein BJX62DRAFT_245205 [Aspergillus germanicus]
MFAKGYGWVVIIRPTKREYQLLLGRERCYCVCHAAGVTTEALKSHQQQYPHLDFRGGQVQCLHGKHRLKAAEDTLAPSDRWWTVDLYLNDISPDLRIELVNEYANENPPTDGEVGEWRQAGTAPGRDAVVQSTSHRHVSRDRTSSNTAGHRTLRVLARPQSSALVAALYDAEHRHTVPHSALVLGPYGRPPDLARFGIVLLILEDIGIARVFSLIQTLVLASEQHRAMVRKLIVVWQMEDLDNRQWVNMQNSLDLDRQEFKILRFILYYRRNRNNEPSRNPGTRIRFMKGSVDVAQTITTYMKTRRGSMLVGRMYPLRGLVKVCARQSIRNQVKAIVQRNLSDDLRLLDLDVKQCHRWSNIDTTVADTTGPFRNHGQWVASRIAEGRGQSR